MVELHHQVLRIADGEALRIDHGVCQVARRQVKVTADAESEPAVRDFAQRRQHVGEVLAVVLIMPVAMRSGDDVRDAVRTAMRHILAVVSHDSEPSSMPGSMWQ